jgi:hypothetical protein
MRVLYAVASLLIITLSMALGLGNAPVAAAYKPQIVISHVQVRSADAASHEAVTIFNNSEYAADITDWCLHYTAATTEIASPPKGTSKLFCFDYLAEDEFLLLGGYGSVTVFSKSYIDSKEVGELEFGHFLTFGKSLSDSSGHLYLLDAASVEQDRVGWGSANYAAGSPTIPVSSGSFLQRLITSDGLYQHTDNNLADFEVIEGNLYEAWTANDLVVAFDLCSTIPGVQLEMPVGYEIGEGDCVLVGQGVDDASEDVNDDSDNSTIDDLIENPNSTTEIEYYQGIIVNEIMPNPAGADGDNEYIELYNSNSFTVDISGYILRAGAEVGKYNYYAVPAGTSINPGGFWVIYSKDFGFNLVNKTGQVSLLAGDSLVSQSATYATAPDNQSWSLIDGEWVYTKNLTPGLANAIPAQAQVVISPGNSDGLKPCADNQYRNPETNRCRLITTSTSALTPCKEGQERNPETNRCRSIATEGSTLVECKEGQERNLDTNRCRQVLSASIPSAEYPIEPVSQAEHSSWGWWAAIGVAVLGSGYAIWEWRGSIARLSRAFWLKVRSAG